MTTASTEMATTDATPDSAPQTTLLHDYRAVHVPGNYWWLVPVALALLVLLFVIVAGDADFTPLGLLCSVSFLGLAGLTFYLLASQNNRHVEVHEDRIIYRAGDTEESLQWGEIQRFETYSYRYPRHGLLRFPITDIVLIGPDNRRITIGPYLRELGVLERVLLEAVKAYHMPEALRRLDQGERLRFGAFSIDAGGLLHGDQRQHWEDVWSLEVDFDRGRVDVILQGDHPLALSVWVREQLTNVRDAPLFIVLAQNRLHATHDTDAGLLYPAEA